MPWYHQQFDFVKETPFDVPTVAELLSPAGLRLNRGRALEPGRAAQPLGRHDPAARQHARQVNGAEQIVVSLAHVREGARGRPGLVAVDLWKEGDVVGAARALNR